MYIRHVTGVLHVVIQAIIESNRSHVMQVTRPKITSRNKSHMLYWAPNSSASIQALNRHQEAHALNGSITQLVMTQFL